MVIRRSLVVFFACASLLAAGVIALTLGATSIPLRHAAGILAHTLGLPLDPVWPAWERTILLQVRLPRILVGMCVGGGLGLCGGALQGLFRNPLADPAILGVSSGASLGAVIALYLGLAVHSIWALPLLACLGAGCTAFAVSAIASRRGHTPIGTLLLAGVAMSSLMTALTSFVLSLALADYNIGSQIVLWILGGLDGRTWDHVKLVAPATCIGAALILAYARELDVLLLGELHATSVGVDVSRVRRALIITTSLVTGVGVAASGAIGFVGLVIPHILRLLIGPHHRWLLPLSMLVGAAFLVLTDSLARTLIAPEEIRLGVITASIGAPFFLFLLLRHRREGLL
jgi:iron complex transport system permease protein